MADTMTRYRGGLADPFGEVRREFDQLFTAFAGDGEQGSPRAGGLMFNPQANVSEGEDHYEVTLDLPGIKPEDLDLEVKDHTLVISGERRDESRTGGAGKRFHRVERRHGHFRRVLPLAGAVDESQIDAEYRDGVLTVTLPKSEAAKPRKIGVRTAGGDASGGDEETGEKPR